MTNNKSIIAGLVCTCAFLFNAVRTQATELNIADPVRWGNHATAGYASTGTTITINEQIGSLGSNMVFSISGDGTYTNFLSYSGPGTYTGDPRSGSNTLTITLSDMTNFGLLTEADADALYYSITNNFLPASTITNMLDAKVSTNDTRYLDLTGADIRIADALHIDSPTTQADLDAADAAIYATVATNYVKITDGVSTNQEFAGTNSWSSGRVHYLPIDADINAYIASAAVADGDVVELGAGTNTVTASISVQKSIHLRGQGRGKTTIFTSTDMGVSRGLIEPTVSNVTITDMSITATNQTSSNVSVLGRNISTGVYINNTGWRFERLEIKNYSSDNARGIIVSNSDCDVIDCSIEVVTSFKIAQGINVSQWAGGTSDRFTTLDNVVIRASGNSAFPSVAVATFSSSPSHVATIIARNCNVASTNSGTGSAPAALASHGSVNTTIIGGTYSGKIYDLGADDGTLTVHGAVTLANGTTSGTITYAGTTEAGAALTVEGVDVMDAIAAKEDALGNPLVDDYVLSSKTDGTRSWVENAGGGGGGLTNSNGGTITVASTNETSTSETEVLTAGAVARLNANDIAATNTPTTVGDVLRVSETGADGRKTMRYKTRAFFYADKNAVAQTVAFNTSTQLTWATNNMVNTGHFEMRNLDDSAAGTTHIKYIGAEPITVIINSQARSSSTFTAGTFNQILNIEVNTVAVAGGNVWGAIRAITPVTHLRTLQPNDRISLAYLHNETGGTDVSGVVSHTNIQIAEY